jgi:hypothetical protein
VIATDWRQVVTDSGEVRIFEALEDPRWDWRTITALSRASGLDAEETRRVLRKYPVLVRQSAVPGPKGEELYTLQSRYFDRKTFLEKVLTSVSASSVSSPLWRADDTN